MCCSPVVALDAVTAIGPGPSIDLGRIMSIHTLVRVLTGSPTSANVSLEGSHDGANWFTLASATTSSAIEVAHGQQRAVRYVRANLTTLSGGTAPTVSATIASVEG